MLLLDFHILKLSQWCLVYEQLLALVRARGVRDDLFTSLGDVILQDLSDFLIYVVIAINSSAFASSLRL